MLAPPTGLWPAAHGACGPGAAAEQQRGHAASLRRHGRCGVAVVGRSEAVPQRQWLLPHALSTARGGPSAITAASLAAVVPALATRAFGTRSRRLRRRRQRRRGCLLVARGEGDGAADRLLLLGGSGRIGTAAAAHLLLRRPSAQLFLAGRDEARGAAAVEEVREQVGRPAAEVTFVKADWLSQGGFSELLSEVQPDAVLHTAGPFDEDHDAEVLGAAISARVPVFVDVADPMEYIAAARARQEAARDAQTMAVVCAGAFPGLSNVIAMECAARLGWPDTKLVDLDFAYFTAGLGGSGAVNLLITNLGFGVPVPVFRGGRYDPQMIAGAGMRRVPFFIGAGDAEGGADIGERDVWSWPFPEAATVGEHLHISGNSNSGMGTAPGIWNAVLVLLVTIVPRELWKERWFSEGLAWISLPLVWLTDRFVQETHAMRVKVKAADGRCCLAVQSHVSFRQCVAQSAAEFLLHLLDRRRSTEPASWQPGVWLPEELAAEDWRPELLQRLTTTPGTTGFAVSVEKSVGAGEDSPR